MLPNSLHYIDPDDPGKVSLQVVAKVCAVAETNIITICMYDVDLCGIM